jgi:hypothetical protein
MPKQKPAEPSARRRVFQLAMPARNGAETMLTEGRSGNQQKKQTATVPKRTRCAKMAQGHPDLYRANRNHQWRS